MANQFNNQSQQYGGQYEASRQAANTAQQNLQNYTNNMADPGQLYGQYLQNAQQMYGFNPQDLLRANKALANTQTTIANLPQAVAQQGNYYGTTAGAQTNNYAQQAGNLNGVLQGQANAAGAFQNVLGATQQQANQQATLGYQGEQLKSQNLESLYNNALSQQTAAKDQMQYFANLYQQQGSLSAQQAAQYGAAQASYAQASQASAQAALLAEQLKEAQNAAAQATYKGPSVITATPASNSNYFMKNAAGNTSKSSSSSGGFNQKGSTTGNGQLFTGFTR